MDHLFIINPEAGKGRSLEYIERIKNYFKNVDENYYIEVTKYPGHATELVRSYTALKDYRVYAVGGDGTLNEVLNGIVGTGSVLAVIPCGSGNDFVKSIIGEDPIEDIFISTLRGKEKYIDLGRVNDRYFINISSVGFDSEVVYSANMVKKFKYITGPTAYILGILITLFKFKFIKTTITIDGVKFDKEILLAAIANGRCYGGGVKISPKSDINDGIFDLCVVDKVSKLKIFLLFPKAIKGTHENIKQVSFYKGRNISIVSREEFVLNIDGELIKEKEVNCELIRNGIKVLFPESHEISDGEDSFTEAAAHL